jgi:hypothetical protein
MNSGKLTKTFFMVAPGGDANRNKFADTVQPASTTFQDCGARLIFENLRRSLNVGPSDNFF